MQRAEADGKVEEAPSQDGAACRYASMPPASRPVSCLRAVRSATAIKLVL